MADFFDHITSEQADLIRQARLFFVATADPALTPGKNGAGAVNVSPKGGVPLHVLDERRVAYLDYVGSGNETARHSLAGGPITLMVCAFEQENAAVVRLYGRADVTPLAESPHAALLMDAPADDIALPQRQAIVVSVEGTSTSCGYGVPVMAFEAAAHGARAGAALQAGEEERNPETDALRLGVYQHERDDARLPCRDSPSCAPSPAARAHRPLASAPPHRRPSSISISPDITTA